MKSQLTSNDERCGDLEPNSTTKESNDCIEEEMIIDHLFSF